MLVVRVTENVGAVQSSYYSSCPWIRRLCSSGPLVLLAKVVPNPSSLPDFRNIRLAGMAAKKNPGGLLNCGSAELGLVLAMAIDN
jgi:hypothetical protein